MVGELPKLEGLYYMVAALGKFITTVLSLKYLLSAPCWGSPLELPSPDPTLSEPRGGPSHGAALSRPCPKKMGGVSYFPWNAPDHIYRLFEVWGLPTCPVVLPPVVSPLPL